MDRDWLGRQAEKRDLAELRVLGTALARVDFIDLIVSRLPAEIFRNEGHAIIAQAIWSLRSEGKSAGIEEVLDRLVGQKNLEMIGGAGALFDLLGYAEGSLQAIDDLLELQRRREIYRILSDGSRLIMNPDLRPDDVAAQMFGQLRNSDPISERSPITTDELLEMERPEWLIDGIFPQGLNVMFGSPKSGKSYLALTMAWSIATGMPWFSRNRLQEPRQVLYLAGEGVGDLRLRAESLLEHSDIHPGGRLAWWPISLQLARETDAAKLRLEAEKLDAQVIFVDTWARYAGVRDENDAAQTQSALAALEALGREGRSVILIHHSSKAGEMRGSSALAGAVESSVRVEINEIDGRVRLSSEMSRRGGGFRDIMLGWRKIGPDSVLVEESF